ncbi:MAG TPA: hypothetical protein VM781_01100, partial [Candidatus Bathyarchaeia archaeon]|nr:hypothetical protein [Candidatus Bathyarchaeia archaeon]
AAEEATEAAAGRAPANSASKPSPFGRDELRQYFQRHSEMLQAAANRLMEKPELVALWEEALRSLQSCIALLDWPGSLDVEDLERRLTLLDERIHAGMLLHASEELLLRLRREMDGALSAYRRKMKTGQLALVEKQFLQKRLLEEFRVPRLSLFYLS